MKLVRLHRALGLCLLVFIVAHLINHAALFWGVDQHLRVQERLRIIYRAPFIEPILLAGFAAQILIGIRILIKRGWPKGGWRRLQLVSGGAIVIFAIQHISAALYTRWARSDIDTNIFWAASVVSEMPSLLYFGPYYVVGIAALFCHVAAVVAVRKHQTGLAWGIVTLGVAFAIAIVTTLSGAIYSIEFPLAYRTGP